MIQEKILNHPAQVALALLVVAIALVAMIVIGQDDDSWRYDTVNFLPTTYDAVVDVLTPILFVALLVERLLEVFVSGARKEQRQPLEKRVLKTNEKIAQLNSRKDDLQAQLDAPGAKNLTPAQIQNIQDRITNIIQNILPEEQRKKRAADADMEKFKGQTRKIAYVVGVFMGLVVAIAGIRTLSGLVDHTLANWSRPQEFLFNSVDVAFTAALLAGGAAGIHQVISLFGDYTKQARKNVQK